MAQQNAHIERSLVIDDIIAFDGTNNYASVETSIANFSNNDDWNINLVIKLLTTSVNKILVTNKITTGWTISTNASKQLVIEFTDGITTTTFTSNIILDINHIYDVYINIDGNGALASNVTFYLNGKRYETQSSIIPDYSSTDNLQYGGIQGNNTKCLISSLSIDTGLYNDSQVLYNVTNKRSNAKFNLSPSSGNHQFIQSLKTTNSGEVVTSTDSINLNNYNFSISCWSNISDYSAINQTILKGTLGSGTFETYIDSNTIKLKLDNGTNSTIAIATPPAASTEPYLGGLLNNRNNLFIINKTSTNNYTFQVNNSKGNCTYINNTFLNNNADFTNCQLLDTITGLTSGEIQQVAIFINNSGYGTYALNQEQQDFIYNKGNGNNLLSEQARKLGIGIFGVDFIGVDNIEVLIYRLWEFENGSIIERIENNTYTLVGATISKATNENRVLKDLSFYNNHNNVFSKENTNVIDGWTANVTGTNTAELNYEFPNRLLLTKNDANTDIVSFSRTISDFIVNITKTYIVTLDVESVNSINDVEVRIQLGTVFTDTLLLQNTRSTIKVELNGNINSTILIGIAGSTNGKSIKLHKLLIEEKGKELASDNDTQLLGYTTSPKTNSIDYYTGLRKAEIGMRGDSSTTINKHISIPNIPTFSNDNPFTINFKLYLRNIVHAIEYLCYTTNNFEITIINGGFVFSTSSGNSLTINNLAINKEYDITITFSTTKKQIYIDGKLHTELLGTFGTGVNANPFLLMNNDIAITGGLNSTLFEVHIFNTVLTNTEINNLYREITNPTTLASHIDSWYLDENDGIIEGINSNATVIGYDTTVYGNGLFETRSALLPPMREYYRGDNGFEVRPFVPTEDSFTCIVKCNLNEFLAREYNNFGDSILGFILDKSSNPNNGRIYFNRSIITTGENRIVSVNQVTSSLLRYSSEIFINYSNNDDIVIICIQTPNYTKIIIEDKVFISTNLNINRSYKKFSDINGFLGNDELRLFTDYYKPYMGRWSFLALFQTELQKGIYTDIANNLKLNKHSKYLNGTNYDLKLNLLLQPSSGLVYDDGNVRIKNLAKNLSGTYKTQYDFYASRGATPPVLQQVKDSIFPINNKMNTLRLFDYKYYVLLTTNKIGVFNLTSTNNSYAPTTINQCVIKDGGRLLSTHLETINIDLSSGNSNIAIYTSHSVIEDLTCINQGLTSIDLSVNSNGGYIRNLDVKDNSNLTTITNPGQSNNGFVKYDISNCNVNGLRFTMHQNFIKKNNIVFSLQNNAMSEFDVDRILVDLANMSLTENPGGDYTGRIIHIGGVIIGKENAAPTDGTVTGLNGIQAVVDLTTQGFTVNTN